MTGFARGLQDATLVTVEHFLFMLNDRSDENWSNRISKQKIASSELPNSFC